MSTETTLKDKKIEFVQRQLEIDKRFKPNASLFKKDARKYYKAWKEYVAKTFENAESFKKNMNFYEDLDQQEKDRVALGVPKGGSFPNGMITQGTASSTLSDVSSHLQKTQNDFAPHFEEELQKLKPVFQEWATVIESLPRKNPVQYSMAINMVPNHAPARLKTALKSLPFKHQAAFYLRLKGEQYHSLNLKNVRESDPDRIDPNKKIKKSHKNAPRVYLSSFLNFTRSVYKNRKSVIWEDLLLALMLATGRRKSELGFQTQLSKASKPQHLTTAFIAKKQVQAEKPVVIPLMYYTVKEALELFTLLRKKISDIGMTDFQSDEETIDSEAKQFDNSAYKVRERFKELFPIEIPNHGEAPKIGTLPNYVSVHNACRGIYAKTAAIYLRDHPDYQHFDPIGLANEILKHGSMKPTLAYLQFNLIDDIHTSPVKGFDSPEAADALETAQKEATLVTPLQVSKHSSGPKAEPVIIPTDLSDTEPQEQHVPKAKKTTIKPKPLIQADKKLMEGSPAQPRKSIKILQTNAYKMDITRLAGKLKSINILKLGRYVNDNAHRSFTEQELLDVAGSRKLLNAFLNLLDQHHANLTIENL